MTVMKRFKGEPSVTVTKRLKALELRIADLEQKRKDYKEAIEKAFIENGLTKFEDDNVIITRIEPTKSTRFDNKSFQETHPELAQYYTYNVEVKGYIKIKCKP
jgi:hypothetical protein